MLLVECVMRNYVCVLNRFNFLDKSTRLSSPVDISSCSIVNDASQTVMVVQPLHLPGIEGLVIPSGTRGHLLKMIDRDFALVRWEVTTDTVSFISLLWFFHCSILSTTSCGSKFTLKFRKLYFSGANCCIHLHFHAYLGISFLLIPVFDKIHFVTLVLQNSIADIAKFQHVEHS